jgi:hypothetical protein
MGPWVVWLILFLVETYTSGIAWMTNHIGPGSLLAGIWFVAAMTKLWPSLMSRHGERDRLRIWLEAGICIVIACLLLNGLGTVRIPAPPLTPDAHRYVREIEEEFLHQPAEDVLLDVGTWVYFKDGVIMKDRAPSIGERGYSETGDFSKALARIQGRQYSKILVRNLHSPDFWYDHRLWRKPSGIRQALLDHYHQTRVIPAADRPSYQPGSYLFGEVSVLEPRVN